MRHFDIPPSRRSFLRTIAAGAALGTLPGMFYVPGLFAQGLTLTPHQTEGPFYPTHLPLDTDNDLLIINDGITPAVGEITHLSGRVLDSKGSPLRNVLVEIWQVDHHGAYLHEGSDNQERRDRNFQGFGRFLTGSTGEYYFRTIKPVPYTGRTPHIHFAVKMKGREKWTTQCYVRGHTGNQRDRIWQSISDPKARDAVTVAFTPIRGSRTGDLSATFDLVMGFTPEI
jgi:protocatechuate 3,4-dioxygenase, beta subunit